jgi:hypothetical protein
MSVDEWGRVLLQVASSRRGEKRANSAVRGGFDCAESQRTFQSTFY